MTETNETEEEFVDCVALHRSAMRNYGGKHPTDPDDVDDPVNAYRAAMRGYSV